MTDPEFMTHAESLLKAVEAGCDRINDATHTQADSDADSDADIDIDIDNQRTGGMITLVFANKSQIVINLQKPLHEVWLAAKSGGYHYKFDGAHWQDTKGQGEFFAGLSRCASEQSGASLRFTP